MQEVLHITQICRVGQSSEDLGSGTVERIRQPCRRERGRDFVHFTGKAPSLGCAAMLAIRSQIGQ